MRKSKFTEEQIAYAIKQSELGIAVEEVCRKMGVSSATFYKWRQKYAGVGPSELRRMRQPEEENRKLKQIVADLSLDKAMLQHIVEKNSLVKLPRFRGRLQAEVLSRFRVPISRVVHRRRGACHAGAVGGQPVFFSQAPLGSLSGLVVHR